MLLVLDVRFSLEERWGQERLIKANVILLIQIEFPWIYCCKTDFG